MTKPSAADDRDAIAALLHRYAQFVRTARGQELGTLFTADATYDICEADGDNGAAPARQRSRMEGRDQIHAYLGDSTGRGIRLVPMIHNLIIDIDGDVATANSVMESRTWPDGFGTIGEYEDSLRRDDGRWRFSARKYTMYVKSSSGGG
jgi:hypothetical protein